MNVIEIDLNARTSREISLQEVAADGPAGLAYWIIVEAPGVERLQQVAAAAGVPQGMLLQWLDEDSFPGITEDSDSISMTIEYWDPTALELVASRFHLFLSAKVCVTYAPQPVPCIEHVLREYEGNLQFAQSIGFIVFLLLDRLISDYVRSVRVLEDRSERIDRRLYGGRDPRVSEDILALKRRVLFLKRVVSSTLHVLMRLSGRRMAVITKPGRDSLAHVYDHAQMLVHSIDALRDMANSSQEAYLALNSDRLNEKMKVLTLFASIILPMTLIAGIYGMNFQDIPELSWPHGYYMALGLMGGSGLLLLVLFKIKGWF